MKQQTPYIDIHSHLEDCPPETIEDTLRDLSGEAQVIIVLQSSDLKSWEQVETLAGYEGSFFPFYGLHPWYADTWSNEVLADLEDQVGKNMAGIGDIGLDSTKNTSVMFYHLKLIYKLCKRL